MITILRCRVYTGNTRITHAQFDRMCTCVCICGQSCVFTMVCCVCLHCVRGFSLCICVDHLYVCEQQSQVPYSAVKANKCAWIIKKSLNLHGRLQSRSSKRRDADVQQLTASGLQFFWCVTGQARLCVYNDTRSMSLYRVPCLSRMSSMLSWVGNCFHRTRLTKHSQKQT